MNERLQLPEADLVRLGFCQAVKWALQDNQPDLVALLPRLDEWTLDFMARWLNEPHPLLNNQREAIDTLRAVVMR